MVLGMLSTGWPAYAQETEDLLPPPSFQTARAEEDYSYLRDPATSPYTQGVLDPIKFLALGSERRSYLTLGGGYRARLQHFTNRNWTEEDVTSYSQRASLHAQLVLGDHLKIFGELYHGYSTSGQEFLETDVLDLHQGFVRWESSVGESSTLAVSVGRQEMELGASRLVGLREGPNLRRSFDMAHAVVSIKETDLQVFYGKEVAIGFEAFDNSGGVFQADATAPTLWGIFGDFSLPFLIGKTELYYLGFHRPMSFFHDGQGEEVRHSFGIRRFGTVKKNGRYNTEFIYQFGSLGDNIVRAFNFEGDWQHTFPRLPWRLTLGLKLDWSSGDATLGDGRLQTFNPLFVNPAIYSLAGVNTPANLTSLHPSILLFPAKGWLIYADYAFFWRTSLNDGLYAPPAFLSRPAMSLTERDIGNVVGLNVTYTIHRNLSVNLLSSYFIPGSFIEASGASEATFFVAPTLDFKF